MRKMLIIVVIINIINFMCLSSQTRFSLLKGCRVSILQDFTLMAFKTAPSFWMRFLKSTTDLENGLILFQRSDKHIVCV